MTEQSTTKAAEAVLVFVHAEPVRPCEELTCDDAGVPGIYAVHLSPKPDPALLASAALDGFHANIPVEVIDDFTYTVVDGEGNELTEHPDHEGYALSSLCAGVDFHESLAESAQ